MKWEIGSTCLLKIRGGALKIDWSNLYAHKSKKALTDYKFYCFNGRAEFVMVCLERETKHPKYYYFDRDWTYHAREKTSPEEFDFPKPDKMDEMFRIADRLCTDVPYLRVDLYYISGKIFFGELTFFPSGGFDTDITRESDDYFGSLLFIE